MRSANPTLTIVAHSRESCAARRTAHESVTARTVFGSSASLSPWEGGPDMEPTQSEIVQKAIAVIDWGDTLQGLIALEGAPSLREIPVVRSYLGYCMARERKQYREGIRLCESALAKEPHNAAHYLNLGRVYLLTRQKGKALATFRKGLASDAATDKTDSAESPAERQAKQQALILAELRRLGIRRRSPFPSLPREHALNRIVGKMLARLQLR